MRKFRVYGIWTASKFIGEFEAETAEQAEDMAAKSEENHASLCHQCTNEIELNDHSAQGFEVEELVPE